MTSANGTDWYERLRGRVGFIVTTPDVVINESTLGTRLHGHDGSRSESGDALGHYRLLHVEDDGAYKIFALVEGAEIRGEAEPNSSVTVRTTVELESYSFEYARETDTDENGTYSIRVPYPGTYGVAGQSVHVPEDAIRNGTTVSAEQEATNVANAKSSGALLDRPLRPVDVDSRMQLVHGEYAVPLFDALSGLLRG